MTQAKTWTSSELPVRLCIGCYQEDDAPRHVTGVDENGKSLGWHMDCHAATGCPICKHQLKDANGKQNHELRDHLVTLPPVLVEHEGMKVVAIHPVDAEGNIIGEPHYVADGYTLRDHTATPKGQ